MIIDDEYLAIEALKMLIDKVEGISVKGTYTNPEEALRALQQFEVDVIFLDIEMGTSHGIKIAEKLRAKHEQVKIVFVTAHAEFAVDAFQVRADDYLLKPVRKERLQETVNRIRAELGGVVEEVNEESKLLLQAMESFQLYQNETEEVKWRTKKVKELFAYIWHHYPNPVPRSRIMDAIWGEKHCDSAVQLMHTSFYHLRKTIRDLGFENPVQFVNEQYALTIDVESDVSELEKIMKQREIGDADIARILQLYKGEYFAEENYQWALAKRQQLTTQILSKLESFVVKKMENDDLSTNLESCLERMLRVDPYNERFVYLAIDYHGRTKNLPEVIKIAGKFEELWTRELGIAVPEEISSLYYKYITRQVTQNN